jgi:hypothetical protein
MHSLKDHSLDIDQINESCLHQQNYKKLIQVKSLAEKMSKSLQ